MSDTDSDDIVFIGDEREDLVDGPISKDGSTIWDRHYASPKADLILISKSMTGFKVDSWVMAKECRCIRDLLHVPSVFPLSESPINLDYNSATLRLFIDLVHARHMPSLQHIKLDCFAYEELLKLCDQLEAPDIADGVMENLRAVMRYSTTGLDPWRVFKLASQRDDVELARLAAVKIHKIDFGLGEALFTNKPSFFDGIPVRYMAALMRSAFRSVGHFGPKESVPRKGWIQANAEEIAKEFKLD